MERGDQCCPDGGGGVAGVRVTEAVRAESVSGLDEGMTAAAVLTRAVVRERQVFVLGADGSYDVELNRFFRDLDAWGVRAASSVTAYARDISVFCRFLEQARGGKSIWVCDAADLAAFKRVRLHGDPEQAVSVPTWRRSIAALDKWAAWAKYEGLIEELPFRYADKTVWTPNGLQRIRVNAASEPDPAGAGPLPGVRGLPDLAGRRIGGQAAGREARLVMAWSSRRAQLPVRRPSYLYRDAAG